MKQLAIVILVLALLFSASTGDARNTIHQLSITDALAEGEEKGVLVDGVALYFGEAATPAVEDLMQRSIDELHRMRDLVMADSEGVEAMVDRFVERAARVHDGDDDGPRIENELAEVPLVRARLLRTLGRAVVLLHDFLLLGRHAARVLRFQLSPVIVVVVLHLQRRDDTVGLLDLGR